MVVPFMTEVIKLSVLMVADRGLGFSGIHPNLNDNVAACILISE